MAYSADSFVADEQPTTAKWNKLWTNDASFNDGTGIDDDKILTRHVLDGNITSAKLAEAFFRGRYQENTTDGAVSGETVQRGWGFVTGDGSTLVTDAVTFDEEFLAPPFLIVGPLGVNTATDPDSIDDFNATDGSNNNPAPINIATTGFSLRMRKGNISALTSGTRYGYSWLAAGAV